MNKKGFFRTVLDNGLTVILQEQNIKSTSFGIGIRFGSIHHPAAHFIEHLLFKGTKTRTYKDINRQAVCHGGSLDAFTDFFSTFYATKNLTDYAPEALELLCDMVTNSVLPETEINQEKLVVTEETRMRAEESESMLADALYRNIYYDHPLGRDVLDCERCLQTISYEELKELYRRFYTPQGIIIVGVGQINKEDVLNTVKKYFKDVSTTGKSLTVFPFPQEESLPLAKKIVIPKMTKQVHLMIGFKTVPCAHSDDYPLRVLSAIMGENIVSRLFEKTREKQGLVYNISSHYDVLRSSWRSILRADCSFWHGVLRIYSRFTPRNLLRVEEVIRGDLSRFTREEVSKEELGINQQKLVGEHKLALIGTFRYMHLLFVAELNNNIEDFNKFNEKILAVTPSDILRVARQYCSPSSAVWAILKPKR